MQNAIYPMECCALLPQARRYRHPAIVCAAFAVTLVLFTFMEQLIRTDLEAPETSPRPPIRTVVMDKDPIIEVLPPTRPAPPEALPEIPEFADSWEGEVDFESEAPPPSFVTALEGEAAVGVDSAAMPIVRIAPDYPRRALSRGIEGYVDLMFDISPAGYPVNIRVVGSEPAGVFDRAAERALKRWKYRPKQEGGVAVMQHNQSTRIRFDLDN